MSEGVKRPWGEARRKQKARRRAHQVTTTINGVTKHYRVLKRPRPELCELCTKLSPRLDWHHWDDGRLELGMWLCRPCHMLAEALERGLDTFHIKKYFNLKSLLTSNIDNSDDI